MPDPTVMDAINEALAPVTPTGDGGAESELENTGTAADGAVDGADSLAAGDDQDAAGAAESDDAADGSGEGAVGEDGAAGEGGAAAAGLKRDPATGKFVKAEQPTAESKDGKPGEKKPDGDAAAAAAAAAKKPDHINDPIPKDLKPATQERMRSLVKTAKELETERDTVRRDFDFMVQGIQATGTTPEQYQEVLSFMALFNSNDAAQQEKALELLDSVADRLAALIGKERNVSDPLANHPDLREAVAKGQVTAKYAKELATVRNQGAIRTEINTAVTAQTEQQRAAKIELDTARSDLNSLEQDLMKSDPNYAAKKAAIVPILQPIFKTIRPSQWKAAFQEAYKNARGMVAANPRPRPAAPQNQPLRAGRGTGSGVGASNGAGGMQTPAGSALDAMSAALAGMGK